MTSWKHRLGLLGLTALALLGVAPAAPALAASSAGTPSGALDPLQFFPDGSPVLYGWAADPDDQSQALDVHVYVDGVRGYVLRTATFPRPDVAAIVGAPDAGFVGVLPPQGAGRHTVCAYAINVGAGENSQIGCRPYGVEAPPTAPFGALDPLQFFPDGSPVVYGWAADRDDLAAPLDVAVYVDGARGYVFRTGGIPRPDVTAATGAVSAGFVGVLPPQGPGAHTVCAYGINIGTAAANSLLGCRPFGSAVTPPGPPAPPGPPTPPGPPAPPGPVKDYANCTDMHVDYPHGVGRTGAVDHVSSGSPVTTFAVNDALYSLNSESDADHDGIACEA